MKTTAIAGLLGALAFGSVQAEEVTFAYTAVIDRTEANHVEEPGVSFLGTTLVKDQTVRGTITLDLATPQAFDGPPVPGPIIYAHYQNGASRTRASLSVDQTGFRFDATPQPFLSNVGVTNSSSDGLNIAIYNYGDAVPNGNQSLAFDFTDNDGTQFADLRQPSTLSLAGWESATLRYAIVPTGSNSVYTAFATITSLGPVTPVPEPASVAMLALGLLTVGGAAWRRRQAGSA